MAEQQEPPRAPRGLGEKSRELWRRTVREYELTDAELVVLGEACRVLHIVEQLEEIVEAKGFMASSSQGLRTHPAVVEQRQQRLLLSRLLRELRLPADEGHSAAGEGARLREVSNG
ncbi:hypothetical protein BJF77_12040 [Kocuria sp. CNJ-770]|uniref:hypothetical protein n=1 Tax=Kocuria sp. CNJ-770 TaxID=1904964 RepID=UPI000966F96C|nr:hypothetical protein [Kocuria sp. CNJ-770]OLT08689.1 hypothetical protein BJF77_12040 [Kocuria sp. CNJ-770]